MIARNITVWSLLALLIFSASFFAPVFFGNLTVSPFDLCYFAMPAYRDFTPRTMHRPSNHLLGDPVMQLQPWDMLIFEHKIPFPWLWNPYAGFGAPLLGNGQSSPFFPLKWIAYLGGVRKGFGYMCFLKMWLAGIFSWLYMRKINLSPLARLLGSVCFMASGPIIAWLQYPMSSAGIFVPLIFLGCEYLLEQQAMRGFLILVLALSGSALAGHPETTVHSLFVAGVYLLFGISRQRHIEATSCRGAPAHSIRPFLIFASACIVAILIAGVQLVPTLEYVLQSANLRERVGATQRLIRSCWFMEDWEYARREIFSYFLPNTWGNPSMYGKWWNHFSNFNESAGYAGVGALLLSLVAWRYFFKDWRIRAFCVLQLLSLAFILKIRPLGFNPEALPLFNILANKRFLFIFCFSNASLAAMVFDRFCRRERMLSGTAALLSAFTIVLAFCALYDYATRFAGDSHAWIRSFGERQIMHFSWALLPWLSLCVIDMLHVRVQFALLCFLVILVCADLFTIHYRYNSFIDVNDMYPTTPALSFLMSKGSRGVPPRVLPVGAPLGANISALYGIDSPVIYDAITASWYDDFSNAFPRRSWNRIREIPIPYACTASIQYLWTKGKDAQPVDDLVLAYSDKNSRIYENKRALPRAYLATSWSFASSPEEAIASLKTVSDPWNVSVMVESKPFPEAMGGAPAGTTAIEPARIIHYSPDRVSVEIPGGSKGFLILNDLYFPGWVARCNGKSKHILRANGIFRAVWVDANERIVEFIYKPRSFYLGVCLSFAGIALCAAIIICGALRNRIKSSYQG